MKKGFLAFVMSLLVVALMFVLPVQAEELEFENIKVGFDIHCMNVDGSIFVYWNNCSDIHTIRLYEGTENDWTLVDDADGEALGIVADVPEENNAVNYVAIAELNDGQIIRSNIATNVYVPMLERYFPYALEDGIVLEWQEVEAADEYLVYKYVSDDFSAVPLLMGKTSDTTYMDVEAKNPDCQYWYAVRAVKYVDNRCYLSDYEPTLAIYDPLRTDTDLNGNAEFEVAGEVVPSRYPKPQVEIVVPEDNTISKAVEWILDAVEDPDATKVLGEKGWHGKNYSCSSLVSRGYIAAGVPLLEASNGKHFYTDSVAKVYQKCGFVEVTDEVNMRTGEGLQRGDVIINGKESHTGMYLGEYNGKDNMIINATGKHWITKWNGKSYNWGRAFRYIGE